jgi:hypothetical protein
MPSYSQGESQQKGCSFVSKLNQNKSIDVEDSTTWWLFRQLLEEILEEEFCFLTGAARVRT